MTATAGETKARTLLLTFLKADARDNRKDITSKQKSPANDLNTIKLNQEETKGGE